LRELELTKSKADSGFYGMPLPDTILRNANTFAQNNTITGSIGVLEYYLILVS
jgi:hypothetical protein